MKQLLETIKSLAGRRAPVLVQVWNGRIGEHFNHELCTTADLQALAANYAKAVEALERIQAGFLNIEYRSATLEAARHSAKEARLTTEANLNEIRESEAGK